MSDEEEKTYITNNPYQVVEMSVPSSAIGEDLNTEEDLAAKAATEEDSPPGRGAPSKYKEEYCQQVIEHMSKGFSLESFGALVEVHKDTLYEWKKVHPEFDEAVKIGLSKSLLWWEKAGMNGMLGLPVAYKDEKGNVKVSEKGLNANIYALQMANKHKWRTGREDITSDDKKVEPTILYIPKKVPEGSQD